MIAARQIAFGKAAGAAKPYKARLEYLESTGTQYIDTGISVSNDTEFSANLAVTESGTTFVFGIYGEMTFSVAAASSGFWVYDRYNSDRISSTVGVVPFQKTSITATETRFIVDGVENIVTESSFFTSQYTAYLFAWNRRAFGTIGADCGKMKIYNCEIKGGNGHLTLIPVLDNDLVPCMYDEVSGEFFYNQGEGEFIAGPVVDDVEYTAKDYIQDGLVVMWDDIESLYGVDGWLDIVSGTPFPSVTGDSFDNGFICVEGYQRNIPATNVQSTEIVYEILTRGASSLSLFGYLADSTKTAYVHARLDENDISSRWLNFAPGYDFITRGTDFINGSMSFIGSTSFILYWNGAQSKTRSDVEITDFFIGNSSIRIKCIRQYSRALTAEEIAYNYSIDKARFGL